MAVEKDCSIQLLDNELNEITGGFNSENLSRAGHAVLRYGVKFPRDPEIMVPVKPDEKLEDIEKLLKEWKEKWEKRKEEKDKMGI